MKLKTVGTNHPIGGTSHYFYCCIDKNCKSGNKNEMKIQHRIFSTAPTEDQLCVISLTFASNSEEERRKKQKQK